MLKPNYIFQMHKKETMECNEAHFGKNFRRGDLRCIKSSKLTGRYPGRNKIHFHQT